MKWLALTSVILILLIPSACAADTNRFCITEISPRDFSPSDLKHVDITIENIMPSGAHHVTVDILSDEPSPVKFLGETRKELGMVIDKETVQYEVYIDKDADNGVYYVPMLVKWSDEFEGGKIYEEKLRFSILISGELKRAEIDILNVTTVPDPIRPGDDFLLRVELKNFGHSDARSLVCKLLTNPPFAPTGSDTEKHISLLEQNETSLVDFNMHVDETAVSGQHTFNLILEYEDDVRRDNVKNSTIGVVIKGAPRIYIQEIILEPSKLVQDTEGLLMVRVINTGTEVAEDVKVRIADDILTESHYFIGEIPPGESTTATFGVYVDDAETGKYGLKMDISYEDEAGYEYNNSKIYEVSVYSKEPFIPMEYVYALIAIVVVSIAVYFIIRPK